MQGMPDLLWKERLSLHALWGLGPISIVVWISVLVELVMWIFVQYVHCDSLPAASNASWEDTIVYGKVGENSMHGLCHSYGNK